MHMVKGRVFIFDWNAADAAAHAALLRGWGWEVDTESEDGARGGNAVKLNPPAAVVFYLAHKPSHGRETADYLAQTKATRNIPLIFVGGEGEPLDKTRGRIPSGIFISEDRLQKTLEKYAK
jgi:hypothetical protein